AESFAERTRQARVQVGFYRIASILGHSLSLAETYDAVAQAASEALGGTFAALFVPRGERLEVVGSHELPAGFAEAFEGGLVAATEPLADAAREGRILAASSVGDDERFGEDWRQVARRCGCRSLLAVPV